ncbi:MAG: hypothetical protein HWN67_10460 [Candidatus Helarchaeota archaeon]|nr:hypothetical protein [Candidatus Helarchaeota archaeon]
MEVFKIVKVLFRGTVRGTVTSTVTHVGCTGGAVKLSFIFKIDESINGIPEEFTVFASKTYKSGGLFSTHMREGDTVKIKGQILQTRIKEWQTDIIFMKADHIFNENLNFGY